MASSLVAPDEFACRTHLVSVRQTTFSVDGLPLAIHLPHAVALVGVIAHVHVPAILETVRNDATILDVEEPAFEIAFRVIAYASQSRGIWIAQAIKDVGKFGILRRTVG